MATKLEIILELQNKISSELKAVRKDVDSLGKSAKRNSTNVKSLDDSLGKAKKSANVLRNGLIALGGVALFVGAIRKIADFEQSMAGVNAVILATNKNLSDLEKAEAFKALSAEARRLGATTVFSASQAASGLEFLGRAGFSANEAIASLEGTLNLAAAGGLELAEAADIASNVLSGFNLPASEAGRVADVLAATAASANTNVSQLGEAIKFVAPIAAAMGVPLETASAAIGKLSDAGLQGSTAGTGLRRVLATLNTPSKKLSTVMKGLELSTAQVAVTGDNLAEVMGLLGTAGLSATDALQLFGDRGAPAALALANVSDELKILNEDLKKAEGRAKVMADVMSNTLIGSFKQLNSAIEETLLQTGDAGLLGNLRNIIDTLSGVIRTLNGTQDPLDKNAVAYRKVADAVEAVGVFVGILIGTKILSFLGGVAIAAGSLGAKLKIASVGMRAAAVGAGTLQVGIASLGRTALLALGPLGWIVGIGIALVSFAKKDAPQAVGAMKDLKESTEAFTESLQNLSVARLDVDIELNFEQIELAESRITELQDKARSLKGRKNKRSKAVVVESISGEKDNLAKLKREQALLQTQLKIAAENEEKIAKEKVDKLSKLTGEAQQADISQVKAKNEALNAIAEANLQQEKSLAKNRESIKLESLKQELAAEKITIQEYFDSVELLSQERHQADLNILDNKLRAVKENKAAELAELERGQTAALAGDNTQAEIEQIKKTFAAKKQAIESNFSVEFNTLKLQREKIAVLTETENSKRTTQELKAITDDEKKKEAERKAAFDLEITAILDRQTKRAEAAERDVKSGVANDFDLGNRVAASDDLAIEDLKALREETILYNQEVQDPQNRIALEGIDALIEENTNKIGVNAAKVQTFLASGLTDAFLSIAEGTKSAKEAFKDFAAQFLRDIARMITQALVLQAIRSVGFGFAGGGAAIALSTGGYVEAKGFAEGGYITGKGTNTSDSIPARLSNGEYVLNAGAVQHYGLNFIEALNRMKLNSGGELPRFAITRPTRARFATGGSVAGQDGKKSEKPEVKLRVVNNVDPDLVDGYMNSRSGEDTILNLISNNADKIKGMIQ